MLPYNIIAPLVVPILKPSARELGEKLADTLFPKRKFKDDQRWIQAQIEYLNQKKVIEKQLIAQAERVNQLKELELQQQWEISRLQRELLRELQANEIKVKLRYIEQNWDKDTWFSNLSRQETEQILHQAEKQHRLLMLVSPPRISKDCPESLHNNLLIQLPNKLRELLAKHYPQNSKLFPVEFYGDYFKRPISDIDVKRLETVLQPVPTAIFYCDITDYEVNFHVGFWGVQSSTVALFPIPAWNWEDTKKALQAAGQSEKDSLLTIRKIIITVHQLLAAFVADWYYLNIDPNYEPQLFQFGETFVLEGFGQDMLKPYVDILREIQQQQLEAYRREVQLLADYTARKSLPWRCDRTLTGHSDYVRSVAFSPDGQILVSGSKDKTIKIWRLDDGELLATLAGHSDQICAVAISSDGQTLVSGSDDKTIKVWQPLPHPLIGHSSYVLSVDISRDGKILISGSDDKTIKVWHLPTGELIHTLTGHSARIYSVAISSDGQSVVSGANDNTIKIWHLPTGELIRTLEGHYHHVYCVTISPDGQTVVSGSADDTIKIWHLPTGELIRTLTGHSGSVQYVAISPDGQTLASSDWGTSSHKHKDAVIKLWHLPTGELLHTLKGHSAAIRPLAFSPDGKTLVSGSYDSTIKIWRWD